MAAGVLGGDGPSLPAVGAGGGNAVKPFLNADPFQPWPCKAIRQHNVPEKSTIDGSEADPWVAPQLTVVPVPSLDEAFERV